ncbi:tRNA lysidine(34) synthetase TilS [Paenibacillus chitinolyticus]|uniref:tRNA lysidine(34) synthetase TilS n=1 Tax=Paenibacillus chitinolyticus TaxID=79263 RepID=UPI002DBFCBDB|nr:tRNA lysidine(34) synthetase TilS [Paenibacillus chitinolyticus]MEC0247132.1 tRNA lysidine(34) synthetase TilS [Paenibacillus chitinolyticus]
MEGKRQPREADHREPGNKGLDPGFRVRAAVESRIAEEKLLEPGDTVVVAVSGGPDSVALLHLLYGMSGSRNWRLIVAHVNHRFRGEESDREAAFVASFAERLGLPCESAFIDVPAYIEETALNSQVAARRKRYEFLFETARKYGASKIALAHHADDQAETILMRILRGTGPGGLTGIPERRAEKKVELVRPMLRIYKKEVISYCDFLGLAYCRDSSNDSRKYFRNRIRLDAMPYLRQYNDQLPESLNRLGEIMTAENDYMDREADRVYASVVKDEAGAASLDRGDFVHLHVALQRRVIKLILNYLAFQEENVDYARLEAIRTAIVQDSPSNLTWPIDGRIALIREYERICFRSETSARSGDAAFLHQVDLQQPFLPIPEAGMTFGFKAEERDGVGGADISAAACPDEAWFDLDALRMPLSVRNRQAGDRLDVFGLNGTKKVKDILMDAKIPPSRRDRLPLLMDAEGRVLWIPGVRRSRHALVGPGTVRWLHIRIEPPVTEGNGLGE